HRHTPLAFEGIYSVPKNASIDYLQLISNYIMSHPNDFREGDVFTPIPEPQNGGIEGVTFCASATCIFKNTDGTADAREEFNTWIRNAMVVSEQAFGTIGLANKVKVGYFGFDGFVVWGDNNPDWTGIIEQQTVQAMHNVIVIDHYPELVGDTMANDLSE